MRRAISLAKMVLLMIIVCTILSVLLSLLMVLVIESEKTEPTPTIFIEQFLEREISHGVLTGVLTGLAMALYAGVDRWTIRKLTHFRLALFIVAAIVSFLYVGGSFHITHLAPDGSSLFELIVMTVKYPVLITQPYTILVLFGTIAKYATIGLMVLYLAGRYWREAAEHSLKSTGQQAEESLN
ncbi:MAG: hypothetical protein OXG78_10260 [Chloroflexi bacterium]|nr:hypothetical protein [Chloroflexota bacterium]